MGHGKRKMVGDIMFHQVIDEKDEKNIQKHLICQNDACPGTLISESLDKYYLTHPEGRINVKREEPHVLVNMEGDSNATKQRESFKCILQNYYHSLYGKEENTLSNKKSTVHLFANNKKKKTRPKCSCIGKIIHIDTVAQTEADFQKKNKGTESYKMKNIYTQHKAKCDADEMSIYKQKQKLDTEFFESMPPKKANKWLGKRKRIVKTFERDDGKIDIYRQKRNLDTDSKSVLPKTSSKWLGKRRRRSRTICIWPQKVKQREEVGISEKNKHQKQKIALECIREQKPSKEYKERDDCAKSTICAETCNEKKTNFFGKYKENPVVYTANADVIPTTNNERRRKSLIDVKKMKSFITCLYCNSKKNMSKKRSTRRKPIYLKLDVCRKGIKVAIIDKTENSCEQVCRKKFFINKKSPQKTKNPEKQKEKVHTKIKNQKLPRTNEISKNAGDQTEEAKIKIDVDPFGNCTVNLDKIEHKQAYLAQNNKQDPICVYPCKIKRNKPEDIEYDIYKCTKISPKYAGNERRNPLTKTELVIEKCLYPDEKKNIQADPRSRKREKQTCKGPCKLKNKKPEQINVSQFINTIPKNTGHPRGDQLIQIDVNALKKCLCPDKVKNIQKDSRQKYKEKRTCCAPCKKPKNICEWIDTTAKNAGNRIRDQLLEIKVDATDKRVLNPDVIKNKLPVMTPPHKKAPTCVCPSHKTYLEQYISENVCKGRICQKKFQDKNNKFNCKCPHIKIPHIKIPQINKIEEVEEECTDRTCGSNVIKKRYNKCSKKCIQSNTMTKPQFEVQLDSKNLCVLNPEEISQKIIDIVNEVCPGGVCAAARCDNKNLKCKCVQKKPEEITECSTPTCVADDAERPVDLLKYCMLKVRTDRKKILSKCSLRNIKSCLSVKKCLSMKKSLSVKSVKKSLSVKNCRKIKNLFNKNEIKKIKSMFIFICERLKRTSEIWEGSEATKKKSCPLSGFQPKKTNYHRRSGLNLPLGKTSVRAQPALTPIKSKSDKTNKSSNPTKSSEPTVSKSSVTVKSSKPTKSKPHNKCECAKELMKRKAQKGKTEEKQYDTESKQLKKERLKKQKNEEKKRIQQLMEEQKQMEELSKQDETVETNCLADCILGIFNMGLGITHCVLWLLYRIITQPKVTYKKTRHYVKYPKHTLEKMKKWAEHKWRLQKFYMSRSIKGSRSMTILTDELRETRCIQAFAKKGETEAEQKIIEAQNRRRQQRIRKRQAAAVHGCRDILLVTMRRTPCLWVYHLCPDFYPRFLSLRNNFIKICQLFLFCFAVVVWTPCILCCEICRGFICCVTCSQ